VDQKMVDWYFEPALPDEDTLFLPSLSKLWAEKQLREFIFFYLKFYFINQTGLTGYAFLSRRKNFFNISTIKKN
jgi:hypothetical protein